MVDCKDANLKILCCWNTLPNTLPSHHLSERLNKLLEEGWQCRFAHFDRVQAALWLQSKAEADSANE